MADQSNIQSAASKSIRPFRSSEEYLYAMKEDLAEWLNALYDLDVHVDIFMEALETGCALCQHANHVNQRGLEFEQRSPAAAGRVRIPRGEVTFASRNVSPGSFIARDNVSNFIHWCRRDLGIRDALMFESDDLVLRKNEKNFVLCLLEVARRGAKFGMLAPLLIQLEEEIDQEIRDAMEEPPDQEAFRPRAQRRLCDFKNLDAMVCEILGHCSCPSQFPMTKVSEGKYKVGETSTLIFIRVLRNHVMVRVGGGWDTLEHYLNKHDPCRCASPSHRYQSTKPAPKSFPNSNARVSRAPSPGPYHVSESPSTLRVPENTKLMDKRTSSAAESVTVNQNGLPVTPPTRTFSPTNASSKSEMTRHQGTPANPASRAEVISKRSTQSPGPLAQGVHARTTFLSRPRDRSEPRFSSPGRARDSSTPWRQPGERENTSVKSGRPKTLLCAGKPATEEVLIINRTEGRHVIHRPGAQQDPNPQTVRMRRRSESSEQSNGPGRFPAVPLPGRGRARLLREPDRSAASGRAPSHQPPAPDGEARPALSRVKEAQPGRVRADPSKNTKAEANKRMPAPKSPAPPGSSSLHTTPRDTRCPAPSAAQRKARSSSPVPPAASTRQLASTGRRTRQTVVCLDNNRNVLNACLDSQCHQSPAGCTPANPSPWEAGGPGNLSSTHSKTERELYRSFEEELLANTKGGLSESGGGGGETLEMFLHTNAKAEEKDLTDCSTTSSASSPLNVASERPTLNHLGERQRDGAEKMAPGQSLSGCNAMQEEWGQMDRVDGVEWNRGSPSVCPTNNILKTIENVRQPILSSPLGDNKLYTMELNHLHHDSSHTGPPEPEKEQDGVSPNESCTEPGDCSAVDKINSLNEENDPGHGNSEESFIETSSESSVNVQLSSHHKPAVQMRAKKGLKKPDRVPSIYKLKLRPKIQPRTDNRPEKRPSKIPTPVSGKQGLKSPRSPQHPLQDSSHSRRKLKHKIILHNEELQSSSEDLLPSPSSDEKKTPSLQRDDGSWV